MRILLLQLRLLSRETFVGPSFVRQLLPSTVPTGLRLPGRRNGPNIVSSSLLREAFVAGS